MKSPLVLIFTSIYTSLGSPSWSTFMVMLSITVIVLNVVGNVLVDYSKRDLDFEFDLFETFEYWIELLIAGLYVILVVIPIFVFIFLLVSFLLVLLLLYSIGSFHGPIHPPPVNKSLVGPLV